MSAWRPDRLLEGFEALEQRFPDDYDGEVVATLVRLPAQAAPRGAVLYVHGVIDYFFQRHMAERFAAEGYAFYALDCRKHGRSLRAHQHPCFCMDVREYFADLDWALGVIDAPVLLAAHSTGGLVCALYAHEGARRAQLRGLWLNSPFFEFNAPPARRWQLALATLLGALLPFASDKGGVQPEYIEGLHRDWRGEWDFDLTLKPRLGFPVHFGWVRAIRRAQARLQEGLAIACPVLLMHSDEADVILDWRHMTRWGPGLGGDVTLVALPGGLHDLVLSRREVRDALFERLFSWALTKACKQA
ncbi:MAG: alpha/beta hydrolase [Burkholderiales bacterium]|nr:alpha/beta hydrolase [Burkholderiales bacterium]